MTQTRYEQNYPTCTWGPAENSETKTNPSDAAFLGEFVATYLDDAPKSGVATEIW